MTPRYHFIMDYWKSYPHHLELEHKVWDVTPYIIDVRSPYNKSIFSKDIDRYEHIQWLNKNIGKDSWPIHNKPGDWYFSGATVNGETWLGFRTEEQMCKFMSQFPQCIISPNAQTSGPEIDHA